MCSWKKEEGNIIVFLELYVRTILNLLKTKKQIKTLFYIFHWIVKKTKWKMI